MTEPETNSGIYNSLAEAEVHATDLRPDGRETRIEESMYWPGRWTVYAAPRIEEVA